MPTRRQPPHSAKSKRKANAKKQQPLVHPNMCMADIVSLHDDAADVLAAYGLHCIGCAYNQLETLREGAEAHGLTDDDVGNLLEDLTDLLKSAPKKPAYISVTESAAHALLNIAEAQGKKGYFLRVTSDDTGSFCMEFEEQKKSEDFEYKQERVPSLSFIVSPETLLHIGGSTIDHRDGRFKLDLLARNRCACEEGECACRKNV